MARPDPNAVHRRPMASADGRIRLTAPNRPDQTVGPLFQNQRLNIDALHQLVERAEAISEGREDTDGIHPRFFGSCVLCLPTALVASQSPDFTQELTAAIADDERAIRVIEDRTFREISRLLGADTSVDFECQFRTVRDGMNVRVVVDFECPLVREDLMAR